MHGNVYENEAAVIDKILHETPRTRQQKRKIENSPQHPVMASNKDTRSKRFHAKDSSSDRSELSHHVTRQSNNSGASHSSGGKMKRKLLRKKQFGHRLTKYKRLGYAKKRVDVSQANRRKRNEHLQKKRDAKWLFTSMTRSTPKPQPAVNDSPSFESLSDLDG